MEVGDDLINKVGLNNFDVFLYKYVIRRNGKKIINVYRDSIIVFIFGYKFNVI